MPGIQDFDISKSAQASLEALEASQLLLVIDSKVWRSRLCSLMKTKAFVQLLPQVAVSYDDKGIRSLQSYAKEIFSCLMAAPNDQAAFFEKTCKY